MFKKLNEDPAFYPKVLLSDENIQDVIAEIRPQMIEKEVENWTSRMTTVQLYLIAIIFFCHFIIRHMFYLNESF